MLRHVSVVPMRRRPDVRSALMSVSIRSAPTGTDSSPKVGIGMARSTVTLDWRRARSQQTSVRGCSSSEAPVPESTVPRLHVQVMAIALLLGAGLLRPAYSQRILHETSGSAANHFFGRSVAFLPDLQGDGADEILAGSPEGNYALVISGRDGSVVYRIAGPSSAAQCGQGVASVGDIDADGVPDFCVGSPDDSRISRWQGSASIYSGRTGIRLLTLDGFLTGENFGFSIALIGDIDGDGSREIAIGAPGARSSTGGYGFVYIYSGMTLQNIASIIAPIPNARFGYKVGLLGDLDSDGKPEIYVTAPSNGTSSFVGLVSVYSGTTALPLLRTLGGAMPGDAFGSSVAVLSDIDGDGAREFAIGADQLGNLTTTTGTGYVRAFSGRSFQPLFRVNPPQVRDGFGHSLGATSDWNGDGAEDLFVGAIQVFIGGFGYVQLLDGRNGQGLGVVRGGAAVEGLGVSVAANGDVNGDGAADLVVGAHAASLAGQFSGAVRAYTWAPAGVTGSPATLSSTAGGSQTLSIDVGSYFGSSPFIVLGSISGDVPGFALGSMIVPLNPDPYTLFTLDSPNQLPLSGSAGTLDSLGRTIAMFDLPRRVPGSIGVRVHHALLFARGSDLFASNATSVTITP
jgi:hypothetical protein